MKKIEVGLLGATSFVGQYFLALLKNHPFFTVKELYGSERSAGQPYEKVVSWMCESPLDPLHRQMVVRSLDEVDSSLFLFSALGADQAALYEPLFRSRGQIVVSNASSFRMEEKTPLIIPEINGHHIDAKTTYIANPNCSVAGLALALFPLQKHFGIASLYVTTLQSHSGAGLKAGKTLDLSDNVIPFIQEEEEKIEQETRKILNAPLSIRAHATRVNVPFGHLACVTVNLQKEIKLSDATQVWEEWDPLFLPSAPKKPLLLQQEPPEPKKHLGEGMSVVVGRFSLSSPSELKFTALSHNMIRGAAGGAILAAELLVSKFK